MTKLIYILSFISACAGIFMLLGITPSSVGEMLSSFAEAEETLREQSGSVRKKKKTDPLVRKIREARDALSFMGKSGALSLYCAASLALAAGGFIVCAVWLENFFLAPVAAFALGSLPFAHIGAMSREYRERMRNGTAAAVASVTASYMRCGSVTDSLRENIHGIKMPARSIFEHALWRIENADPDVKAAVLAMKERSPYDFIFSEWCDTLASCCDDSSLRWALEPVVRRYEETDSVRRDLETSVSEGRRQFCVMAALTALNIPLLYVMNREWYDTLLWTLPGKAALAFTALVTCVCFMLLGRFTSGQGAGT